MTAELIRDLNPSLNKGVNQSNSLFRGIVVDNRDPYNLCRIRVRVPSICGQIPDEELPWAMPCMPYAGPGYGMCYVPEIGSTVWVLFEGSQKDKPVWIGCSFGGSTDGGNRDLRSAGDRTFALSDGNWSWTQKQVDTPYEYTSHRRNQHVVYKTPKGASILINEEDEHESIEIIDRLGQTFKMFCPVLIDYNKDNKAMRMAGSVEKWDITDGIQPGNVGEAYILLQTNSPNPYNDSVVWLQSNRAQIANGEMAFYAEGKMAKITDVEDTFDVVVDKEQEQIELTCRTKDEEGNVIKVSKITETKDTIEMKVGSTSIKILENGTIEIVGNIIVSGRVDSSEDVTAQGISLHNHIHSCPGGTTSAPLGG